MIRSGIWLLFFISAHVFLSPVNTYGKKSAKHTGSPPQEVFLSFSYRNLFSNVVIAYYEDGQYYLPVSELFTLLEIPHQINLDPPTVTGSYLESEKSFTFNFSKREISLDGKGVFNFNATQMLIMELDFYVTPEVFSQVFDLNFTVNFNNLLLQLETPHRLPIVAEYERALERERQERYALRQEYYPLKFGRDRKLLGGGFLDYSLSSNINERVNLYTYNLNLGTEVLGGDLQGGAFGSISSDTSYFLTNNVRWRYVWRKSNILSQFYAGQVTSDGLSRRSFVGIRATNEPIEPRYIFDEFEIEGETIPGSEVELYFNNALYGYQETSEDGHYRFLAPLTYGSSRLHLRIYEPAGGIIERARRIQVPYSFLPGGELNYHLNIGRLENPLFGSTERGNIVQGDLSYGITSAITQKIGVEYLDEFSGQTPLFYGSTSARLFKQYLFNVDAAPGAFYRFSGNVVYPSSASWNLGYTYFSGDGIYNILGNDHEFSGNFYLPFTIFGRPLNVRLRGNHSIGAISRTRYNFDVNTRIDLLNLRFSYSDTQTGIPKLTSTVSSELSSSITYFVGRRSGIPVLIQGSFLRGRVDYNPALDKLEQAQFQMSRNIFTNGRIRASFTRNFLRDLNFFSLGITIDFNSIRSSSSLRNSNSGVTFTQNLSGSVGYDRQSKRLAFSNRRQVGRAATAVRMFVDNNNSGIYDEGDKIINDNAVRLGKSAVTRMNNNGTIYLTQLQAYNRINLEINKAAITNPLLVPEIDRFSIVTDPNQFKSVDIPFYTSGVISGTVHRVRNGAKEPLSGLRLYLSNEDTSFSKELRTFSDGTFYAYEIPPDTYTLEIDSTQLEFLHAVSVPRHLQFEVRSLAMGDFIENLNFEVIPRKNPVQTKESAVQYQIQIASFASFSNSKRAVEAAEEQFNLPFSILYNSLRKLYAVRTMPLSDLQEAVNQLLSIQNSRSVLPVLVVLDTGSKLSQNRDGSFSVQIGAFSTKARAKRFMAQSAKYLNARLHILHDPNDDLYKVHTQPFDGPEQAQHRLTRVRQQSFSDAFIPSGTSVIYGEADFIYQVWLEGTSAESKQSYSSILTDDNGVSTITVTNEPGKDAIIFGDITYWPEAIKLRDQLEEIYPRAKPVIMLIAGEGTKGDE